MSFAQCKALFEWKSECSKEISNLDFQAKFLMYQLNFADFCLYQGFLN